MWSRRTFLRSLGASIIAGRTLTSPRVAHAASGAAKRFIVFFSPNGTVHDHWRPSGSDRSFTLDPGTVLEPLEPVRAHLTIIDGVDFKDVSNHDRGMAHMLTGTERADTLTQGASIDQHIARSVGGDSRFSSLELGVQTSAWGGNIQTRMSYARAGSYIPPNDDPRDVHRRLFGDVDQNIDVLVLRRRSILDLLRDEIRALEFKLGADEKQKLDAHLESLRHVENGLIATPTVGCPAPASVLELDPQQNDNFGAVGRAQTDLLVAALQCDMTRVASIQWSHTVSPTVFSWLGSSMGHHELSHIDDSNAPGVAEFVQTERWYATQFRYLIERLRDLPEPGAEGSMLDHSVVLWCKELGDSRLHDCISVPMIIAGGGGGCLSPGRYLQYNGEPHTKLLVSLCWAMGLTNPTFGSATHGAGPLNGVLV